jgi:hypothetical protein
MSTARAPRVRSPHRDRTRDGDTLKGLDWLRRVGKAARRLVAGSAGHTGDCGGGTACSLFGVPEFGAGSVGCGDVMCRDLAGPLPGGDGSGSDASRPAGIGRLAGNHRTAMARGAPDAADAPSAQDNEMLKGFVPRVRHGPARPRQRSYAFDGMQRHGGRQRMPPGLNSIFDSLATKASPGQCLPGNDCCVPRLAWGARPAGPCGASQQPGSRRPRCESALRAFRLREGCSRARGRGQRTTPDGTKTARYILCGQEVSL